MSSQAIGSSLDLQAYQQNQQEVGFVMTCTDPGHRVRGYFTIVGWWKAWHTELMRSPDLTKSIWITSATWMVVE